MKNKEIREHMAEHGHEMTPEEIQESKETLVRKIAPQLLEKGMSVDDALDVIIKNIVVNEIADEGD